MKRRLTGALLTSMMIAAALPMSAFAEDVDPADLTVAAVVLQEDQFSSFVSLGMQDAAKDYGVGNCLTANSNNDQAKEVEYINTYLTTGVDGVAIQPIDEDTSMVTLKNASDKGLAVAIEGLDISDVSFAVGGVVTSHHELGAGSGKAAAEFIKNEMDGQANIGIICFDSQYPVPSNDRVQGYLDEIQAVNPDVVIVDRQEAWVQDMAVQVAGDMLTAHPEINLFICANDGGTVGTVMAVKNAGRAGDCFVFGIDCGEQQISMLRSDDNILQAVTAQDAYGMGYGTMEYLVKYLLGDESSVGQTKYLEGTVLVRGDDEAIDEYEALLKSVQ